MHETLGRQLQMTAKQVRRWFEAVMADHDASVMTWIVLAHALDAAPPGLSQRQLADEMGIGGPALVRHIDRLEADGLVQRTPDPHDRRITRITLTRKGRRRHAQLSTIAHDADAELASVLSGRELRTLLDLLSRLEHHAARQLSDGSVPEQPTTTVPERKAL